MLSFAELVVLCLRDKLGQCLYLKIREEALQRLLHWPCEWLICLVSESPPHCLLKTLNIEQLLRTESLILRVGRKSSLQSQGSWALSQWGALGDSWMRFEINLWCQVVGSRLRSPDSIGGGAKLGSPSLSWLGLGLSLGLGSWLKLSFLSTSILASPTQGLKEKWRLWKNQAGGRCCQAEPHPQRGSFLLQKEILGVCTVRNRWVNFLCVPAWMESMQVFFRITRVRLVPPASELNFIFSSVEKFFFKCPPPPPLANKPFRSQFVSGVH